MRTRYDTKMITFGLRYGISTNRLKHLLGYQTTRPMTQSEYSELQQEFRDL